MGVCFSVPVPPAPFECEHTSGLSKRNCGLVTKILDQQERILKAPWTTTKCLVHGLQRTLRWDIYIHVTSWDGVINAPTLEKMIGYFRRCADVWLSSADPKHSIKVCVFGFVFCKGVQVDDSVFDRFKNYPIVMNYKEDGEHTPWIIHDKNKKRVTSFYNKYLHDLKVHGLKSGLKYHLPPSPVHPEGCTGFQTRFWLGKEWAAFAQPHYVRVGGAFTRNGEIEDRMPVLLHEQGHTFGLDDLYVESRFPGFGLQSGDSIMYGGCKTLSAIDKSLMKQIWLRQKSFQP